MIRSTYPKRFARGSREASLIFFSHDSRIRIDSPSCGAPRGRPQSFWNLDS